MDITGAILAAAGALLVAVMNELRARSRARAADDERQAFRDEIRETVAPADQGPADPPAPGETRS